jgi:ATP-dependent metalloprotease FtsH
VGLKNAIAQKSPDLILLDLSISEGHQSSRIQNSLSIIKQLYEINPQLPVLLYSDSPAQRKNFRDAIKRALKLPNILDFFSIEDGHGKSLVDEIPEVLKKLELNHLIDQKTRENVSLSYSLHFEYCAEQQIITVEPEYVEFNIVMQGDDALQGLVGQKRVPDSCLADVIGLERAKHRLAQVIGWMREPQLLANYNVKLPTGFLLSGPPGTGKTLIAKAVAGECRLPFFAVNASDLTSTVVGGASEKIKNLFEQAHRYAPALIFIDEIDAIAKQRNDSGTGVSNEQNAIVNTLLTCMDGFSQSTRPVLVMAATNHPELLDSAILRPGRFDENINCDLPNRKARTILFELFLDKFGLNPNEEEIKQLVDCSLGLSPAEIDRIAREAVYTAIETQRKVTIDDVRESAKNVMYGPKSSSMVLDGLEKRTTAYHEAGHLLAQKILFPKQHIDYVTIEPRGNALGFVSSRQEEGKYSITKIEVQNKLIVLLAGREAELIIAQSEDEITTGASSDLEKATRIACDAIMRSGLDTTIGPISVVSLPRSIQDSISPNVMDQLATWLKTAQDKTRELLSVHRKTLDAIAQALIERESMEHDEIEALFLEI